MLVKKKKGGGVCSERKISGADMIPAVMCMFFLRVYVCVEGCDWWLLSLSNNLWMFQLITAHYFVEMEIIMQNKLLGVNHKRFYSQWSLLFQCTDVILDDKVWCLTVKYPALLHIFTVWLPDFRDHRKKICPYWSIYWYTDQFLVFRDNERKFVAAQCTADSPPCLCLLFS